MIFSLNKFKNIIFDLGGVIINIDLPLTMTAFEELGIKDVPKLFSTTLQQQLFDFQEKGTITSAQFRDEIRKFSTVHLLDSQIDEAWNALLLDLPKARLELLEKVAKTISRNIFKINEKQRKALHISAVFVNNFVNEMYRIGNEICEENKVPFEILKPLILETVNKVMILAPKEAQTGPAKRNDTQTIDAHLDFLSNENHATIYKILTQSIQNNGKEL